MQHNRIIGLGEQFPDFKKPALVSIEKGKEFATMEGRAFRQGQWTVMFWWPKDFTPVCNTEVLEFHKRYKDFEDRDAQLVGASTDSEYAHLAWRMHQEGLQDLKFAMLADTSKSLAAELGILTQEEAVAYRATFIIDPTGIVRWISVHDLSVGRNVHEVLRVLDALQTDELCPCNWEKGLDTIRLA